MLRLTGVAMLGIVAACAGMASNPEANADTPVGQSPTEARTAEGDYISWREHLIDTATENLALSGSDGLVMADLDGDGFEDIISVHESDSEYDSAVPDPDFVPPPEGHVRVAFGSADPDRWTNVTLARGEEAPAPEDVDVADLNGDGFPDVIVAAELSHLLYIQNPGALHRMMRWASRVVPMTENRGSYIRVFFGDFDGDGTPEVTAANKGAQRPAPEDFAVSTPVSVFDVSGDPLDAEGWSEIVLGNYSIPQNAEPVDLDGDGDLDIVVGTRGENRLVWFENILGETGGPGNLRFREHAIGIVNDSAAGFNLEYVDLNGDSRLDILGDGSRGLSWFEQPAYIDDAWLSHPIGSFAPDSITGLEIADIDGDGDTDVIAGSYSRGPRTGDGHVDVDDALGRIGWFENPGDATAAWTRHDVSRRKRGMFDKFIARDMDGDGDVDFVGTRGNSAPFDGVFWLEQVRTVEPMPRFLPAREDDSEEMPLP